MADHERRESDAMLAEFARLEAMQRDGMRRAADLRREVKRLPWWRWRLRRKALAAADDLELSVGLTAVAATFIPREGEVPPCN